MKTQDFTEKSIEVLTKTKDLGKEYGWEVDYTLVTNKCYGVKLGNIRIRVTYEDLNGDRLDLGEIAAEQDRWLYIQDRGNTCKVCETLDKAIEHMLVEYGSRAIF